MADNRVESFGMQDPTGEEELSFAELLDQYDYESPQRGQILEGEILSIDENEILVDVGTKRDAIVPRTDLDRLPAEMVESLEVGQKVLVYVLRPMDNEGNLIVSINKALQQADWERAEHLLETGEVVEAQVVGYNKGGLLATFGRIRGFIPQSHVADIPRSATGDQLRDAKNDMMGQQLKVKVVEVNRERNRLILSEREAQQTVKQQMLENLEVGSIVKGTVVGLVDFGAFVDIGGIDGLIHISNLDRRYVNHPSDVLEIGDEVEVRIDEVDTKNQRISLNRAALMPDPWDHIDETFSVGDLVTGEVTNVADFGVFVALPHHLEGLIHVSEMTSYGAGTPTELIHEGEELLVRIIDIDREQKRIALSLDAVTAEEQERWMHEQMQKQREQREQGQQSLTGSAEIA
ncbi:MAG: S1 RNA-binding domain-containing protein [Aggregatilineales bacterium]|nr:S1 RNA-binding domain-containing protein [Aggregatilineales bacterium]HPV08513.1 S1 RNA-binding domain-containing protein [Aggregatilineales bacterium]HQE18396.1 S1 RNA-binding domain-containing protein [Aggregatilineales bacterium]